MVVALFATKPRGSVSLPSNSNFLRRLRSHAGPFTGSMGVLHTTSSERGRDVAKQRDVHDGH